jgi:hypothetical protein
MPTFKGMLFRRLSRSHIHHELFKDFLEALRQRPVTNYLQNISLLVSRLIGYSFEYELNDNTNTDVLIDAIAEFILKIMDHNYAVDETVMKYKERIRQFRNRNKELKQRVVEIEEDWPEDVR